MQLTDYLVTVILNVEVDPYRPATLTSPEEGGLYISLDSIVKIEDNDGCAVILSMEESIKVRKELQKQVELLDGSDIKGLQTRGYDET